MNYSNNSDFSTKVMKLATSIERHVVLRMSSGLLMYGSHTWMLFRFLCCCCGDEVTIEPDWSFTQLLMPTKYCKHVDIVGF